MGIYWTDFHSNIHSSQMNELEKWYKQVEQIFDFWPIAYYPYGMRKDATGLDVEDKIDDSKIQQDWNQLREFTNKVNNSGYPMFMGYEWQGNGLDGDHNVFFEDNHQDPKFPLNYLELIQEYKDVEAIGIPHHTAYALNNRGKNWKNQNDTFSPFAEIYSSHGSSEMDDNSITMDRHIHMGPRCDQTSVSSGLKEGHHFGIIASGDNHSCPGVYGFGYSAVIAKDKTKEEIWKALKQRHVYGVSKDKIQLDYRIDTAMMGDELEEGKHTLSINVEGLDTIDRIEIIRNEQREELIVGPQELLPNDTDKVTVKFYIEAGWGPDIRVFPEFISRKWLGHLETDGILKSVTPCFSTFGQSIDLQNDKECNFSLTTHSNTTTGKWMGPSAVTTEGMYFEIEGTLNTKVKLILENQEVELSIKEILEGTRVYALEDEVKNMLNQKYGFKEYYRSDPFWHNAYKFRIRKGSLDSWYKQNITREIEARSHDEIRIKVYEKNGSCAWSSPIFIK